MVEYETISCCEIFGFFFKIFDLVCYNAFISIVV